MAIDETPVKPAPETACIVATLTSLSPNCMSGLSVITSTIVEQFGLVTIKPPQPRCSFCIWSSFTWSLLTSGMRRGTASNILYEGALLETPKPARAEAASTRAEMSAGRDENTSFTSSDMSSDFVGITRRSPMFSGRGVLKRQSTASLEYFHALRSEAVTAPTQNHGCAP